MTRLVVKALQTNRITLDLPNCDEKTFVRLPGGEKVTLPAAFDLKKSEQINLVAANL